MGELTATCECCRHERIVRQINGVLICQCCVSPTTWERRSTEYEQETERRRQAERVAA